MSKPVFSGLFSFSGRRNRKSFALLSLTCFGLYVATFAVISSLAVNFGGGTFLFLILACVAIAYAVTIGTILAQRCRDFGWSGWAALLIFVPLLGPIFWIALFFISGTHGPNKYGPDPLGEPDSAPTI